MLYHHKYIALIELLNYIVFDTNIFILLDFQSTS